MKKYFILSLIICLFMTSIIYAADDSTQYGFDTIDNEALENNRADSSGYKPVIDLNAGTMHYDNTGVYEAYCEVKNGKNTYNERFEAMSGVPSKEWLHVNVGLRTMYAIVDAKVKEVPKFTDSEFKLGLVGIHCPVKTSNKPCTCVITYSGSTSGNLSLTNGEHSTVDTWVSQMQSQAENYINTSNTTCSTTIMGGDPPTVVHSPAGTVTGGSKTGDVTIVVPGCMFKDGQPQTITLPGGWVAPGHCHSDSHNHGASGSWNLTINNSHVLNGWVADDDYKAWQNTISMNAVNESPNNKDTNWSDNVSGNSKYNHFYDATLLTDEKWLMNTAGKLWTAQITSDPKVALLRNARIKLGADKNKFDYSFSDNEQFASTTTFAYTRFKDNADVARFVLAKTNASGFSNDNVPFLYRYGQPALRMTYDTGLTIVENPGDGLPDFTVNWWDGFSMWAEKLFNKSGMTENRFLVDFYLKSNINQQVIKDNYTAYNNMLNKFTRFCYEIQGDNRNTVISYIPDLLSSKAKVWSQNYWDTTVLWQMIGLSTDEGELLNLDTLQVSMPPLTAGKNSVTSVIKTYVLHNDSVHNWTKQDAARYFFMMGQDERGYELYGYSGNYKLTEEEIGENGYFRKMNGIWPGSLGNLAYYDNENNCYAYNTDIENLSEVTCDWWPERSLGPHYDGMYLDSKMPITEHIDNSMSDKTNYLKPKADAQNGIYEPIAYIECTYGAPGTTGGTITTLTLPNSSKIKSKYINTHADYSDNDWWDGIRDNVVDNPGCNKIAIHNPVSVQFCKVISNPDYMDQRINDKEVFRGGDSNQSNYLVKEEDMSQPYNTIDVTTGQIVDTWTINSVKYYDDLGNRYRKYLDVTSDEFKNDRNTREDSAFLDIAQRKAAPNINFVNLSKEFELVFSDQIDLTKNQYGESLGTVVEDFHGIECMYYVDEYGNKTYSQQLLGIPTISLVPGFGWGIENADSNGKLYTSKFPSGDRFGEGTHNYVKARYILTPFDMTVLDQSNQYKTFKAGKIVNLNEIKQWESDNENQEYVDLSNITNGDNKFKFTGTEHPYMYDDGLANDRKGEIAYKDRLIYGLCLLSNNEQANKLNYYAALANNYPYTLLNETYINEADYYNNKESSLVYQGHPHVSRVYRYLDIIGQIGNLCLNDTGDFRFANVFKEAINNDTWYVNGIVPRVNPTKSKSVMQHEYNILDDSNKIYPAGNTVGAQPHKEHFNEVSTLPITAAKNNIDALKSEQLRPGYAQFWDIETMGNYNGLNSNYEHLTNRLSVKPYYYLYNYDTETVEPLNVYYTDNGVYHEGNRFSYSISDDNFGSPQIQDQQSLVDRANVTEREKLISEAVASGTNLKTTMFTNIVDDILGTTNLIVLDMNNRDYIGTEYLRGKDSIGINKNSVYSLGFNSGGDIDHIYEGDFMTHNQKYYATLNLPTSAIFIMEKDDVGGINYDATVGLDYQAASQKVKDVNGCILQTLEIQTYGEYWSLQYRSRGTANNERVMLTKDKELKVDRRRLKGELVAVLDNKFNAADDINITGMY